MMNRRIKAAAAILTLTLLSSCVSYTAYQRGRDAETSKDWDQALVFYEKALEIDPNNTRYKLSLQRARRESARNHFEKGKSLRAAAENAQTAEEQLRLMKMAATELELTVKLDSTNQFAAVELGKTVAYLQAANRADLDSRSIDEVKRRNRGNVTKAQPPDLNPASDEPISLSFPPAKLLSRTSTAPWATRSGSTSCSTRPSRTTGSRSSSATSPRSRHSSA
jgi:tetratricopeptide (TPR) repeat protein